MDSSYVPFIPIFMQNWTFGGIVITIAALVGLYVLGKKGKKILQPFFDFLSDWAGTPERKGVPARPGVMERLESMHQDIRDATRHNDRQDDEIETLKVEAKELHQQIETLRGRLVIVESKLGINQEASIVQSGDISV